MAARRRGSLGDLLRSLAVVLAGVGLLVAVSPRPQGEQVRVVDVAAPLALAREAASYDVLAPAGLGEGWRPTNAAVRAVADGRHRWQVGFVTPADAYAEVVQSDEEREDFVAAESRNGAPAGSGVIAGRRWQRLVSASADRRTLWRPAGRATVVVAGTASWAELAELAASLRGRRS